MANSIVSWSQVLLLLLVSSSALAESTGSTGLTSYQVENDGSSLHGAGAMRNLLSKKKKKCPKCQFAGQVCDRSTGFVCKCLGQLQPRTIKKEKIIKKKKKTIKKTTTIKICGCLIGKQVGNTCIRVVPIVASPSPVVG